MDKLEGGSRVDCSWRYMALFYRKQANLQDHQLKPIGNQVFGSFPL